MISISNYEDKLRDIARLELTEREVPETEPVFNVYLNDRQIDVPYEFEDLAVYYDHKAEVIWFAVDRYFDGVDLTSKTWALQYNNANGEEGILPMTYFKIGDGSIGGGQKGIYYRGIDITIDLTKVVGGLTFNLRIYSIGEDGNLDYNLNTLTTKVNIRRGLFVNDTDSRLPLPKDSLTELVDRIEKLYQNQDLSNIDYDTLRKDTLPTINGIQMYGEITTNAEEAQAGKTHLDIPYGDLSEIPTLNGHQLVGALTSDELDLTVETDAVLDTSSANPVQNQAVANKFTTVDGNISAVSGKVSTAENNIIDLDTRLKAIEAEIGNMTFVPLTINSFSSNLDMVEVGQVIDAITFNWSLGGNPIVLTLNDENIEIGTNETTLSGLNLKYTDSHTEVFTLYAKDSKGNEDSAETPVHFTYGVFYGAAEAPAAYDETFVERLTKQLQLSKAASIDVVADNGKYIYYCVPSAYGTPSFAVGGFTGGFAKAATISVSNDYGVAVDYDIYRSTNANLGVTNVVIS